LIAYKDALNKSNMVAENGNNNASTIAAHKEDNENWTSEELKKIEDYKQLLLAARKNQK
jgi:hypothetical protein